VHVCFSIHNTGVKLRTCECWYACAGVSVLGLVTCARVRAAPAHVGLSTHSTAFKLRACKSPIVCAGMIVLGLVTCVFGCLLLCMFVEACAALASSCVHAKCAFVVCACKLFRPCDERVLLAPAHVDVSMRNTAVKLRASVRLCLLV
jgi:hypothetical protein